MTHEDCLKYYCETFNLSLTDTDVVKDRLGKKIGYTSPDKKYVFFENGNQARSSELFLCAIENFVIH